MMKRNEGFTLVELVITIAVATLIIAAATSTLLLGLRINTVTTSNVKQQNATNMLTQIVQKISEGTEVKVIVSNENENIIIQGKDGSPKVEYKAASDEIYLNGTLFMEDVTAFSAALTDDQQLLTVTLTTDGTSYTASTYCRLNPTPTPTPDAGGNTDES